MNQKWDKVLKLANIKANEKLFIIMFQEGKDFRWTGRTGGKIEMIIKKKQTLTEP